MLTKVFALVSLFAVGARAQFPFNMFGFEPTSFANQMQNMAAGFQNMGAFIQSMTQETVADNIRRAQESGSFFNVNDLNPGEFRRFTGSDGRSRGFAYRSADGQSGGFSFGSGGSGGQGSGYFFSSGPEGTRVHRF